MGRFLACLLSLPPLHTFGRDRLRFGARGGVRPGVRREPD